MRFDWSKMGRTAPGALGGARDFAHHAAQWPAKAARANLSAVPDDSHSALTWDALHAALVSQMLPAKGGAVRVGIRIARLELIVTSGSNVLDAFQFDGKTDAAAGAWIDSKLHALGLKPAGDVKLPYALADHPAGERPYELGMLGREFGELSRWFGGPAEVLEEFAAKLAGLRPGPGPLLCWPHHFDIATLVRFDESGGQSARSVGVGASTGDEFYAQPYVYVSPWPRFDDGNLPELPPPGHWHTEGFFGAVATGEEILAMEDRGRALLGFITGAFEIGRVLAGKGGAQP
jgi:hypothetical protein